MWKRVGYGATLAVGAALVGACGVRQGHERGATRLWELLVPPPAQDVRFDTTMVDGLPAPARRYLLHAIAPGTPLARSAELTMGGAIQLSPGAEPLPMRAEQVVRAGLGYVWKARVGRGLMRIRGYDLLADDGAEMRWWLLGLVPVVSAAGEEVTRSAVGRLAAETALLVPSALLPVRGAEWEAVDERSARVRLPGLDPADAVTLEVADDGRLLRLSMDRWNSDPGNGPVGRLAFGADSFGRERTFDGFTVPTTLRVGWRLGQPDERPFFRPVIENVVFR